MESEIVQTVISAPLPVPLPGVMQQSYRHQSYHQAATDDEQLSQASFLSNMAQYEVINQNETMKTIQLANLVCNHWIYVICNCTYIYISSDIHKLAPSLKTLSLRGN